LRRGIIELSEQIEGVEQVPERFVVMTEPALDESQGALCGGSFAQISAPAGCG
jgi:hypothetical protein